MERRPEAEVADEAEPQAADDSVAAHNHLWRPVAFLAIAWSVLTAVSAAAYSAAAIYPKAALGPDASPALVTIPAAAAIAVALLAAARRTPPRGFEEELGEAERAAEPAGSGTWWMCHHRLLLNAATLVLVTAAVSVLGETATELRSVEWVSLWVMLTMAGAVAPVTWSVLRGLYTSRAHPQPAMWASVVLACTAPAAAWATVVSAALPTVAAASLGAAVPALVLVLAYWSGSWDRRRLLVAAGPATVVAGAVLVASAVYVPGVVEERRADSTGCGTAVAAAEVAGSSRAEL